MRLNLRLQLPALVAVALVLLSALPAEAVAVPTQLTVAVPAQVRTGTPVPVHASLSTDAGPVVGAQVVFQRNDGQGWLQVATGVTDGAGEAAAQVPTPAGTTSFRAVFAGDAERAAATSEPAQTVVATVTTSVALTGPSAVVDGHSVTLLLSWTAADGGAVGSSVVLWRHLRDKAWEKLTTVPIGASGQGSVVLHPRVDTWYQARAAAATGRKAATSHTLYVDNKPPLSPVKHLSGAPWPTSLPMQARASGVGANVVVTAIPDAVWKRMVGRSWRSGCPVGRSALRYLRTNYWGFDGYRHRGELVVRYGYAGRFRKAMIGLYAARVRIRTMYLPDRFGYSKLSGGANDYASMRADNTSAFNCRWVTGSPGTRSPHSYGRSIDLNPFENPYKSKLGWLPNSWWVHHSTPYAWRSFKHPVVRIMRNSGFTWTYPRYDPQHFDAR